MAEEQHLNQFGLEQQTTLKLAGPLCYATLEWQLIHAAFSSCAESNA